MEEHFDFNWPVIGHSRIKQFLQKEITNQKLAHAYLFHGPAKVGKTLTAKLFAKTILCENYKDFINDKVELLNQKLPCNECASCHQVDKKTYADLYFVERQTNEKTGKLKKNIVVAQVRDLIEKIGKRAFLNSYKIIIIPESQTLNAEASNALLKTLEEPTPRTIIVLISPNKEAMLPTILSRVQSLKFLPVTKQEIYDDLVAKGAKRDQAKELSSLSLGRPTIAMKYFTNNDEFQDYKNVNIELLKFFGQDDVEKFKLVDELTNKFKNIDDLNKRIDYLISLARDALFIGNYREELAVNIFLTKELSQIFEAKKNNKLKSFIIQAEMTKDYLRKNINPKLALENLVLKI